MRRLLVMAVVLAACGGGPDPVPVDIATVLGAYTPEMLDCLRESVDGDCDLLRPDSRFPFIIVEDRPATDCGAAWVMYQDGQHIGRDGCVEIGKTFLGTSNEWASRTGIVGPLRLDHLGGGVYEGKTTAWVTGHAIEMVLRLTKQ